MCGGMSASMVLPFAFVGLAAVAAFEGAVPRPWGDRARQLLRGNFALLEIVSEKIFSKTFPALRS